MKGFFSFGRKKAAPPAARESRKEGSSETNDREASAKGETHRSLALPTLLAGLRGRAKPEILDLGPAQPANIDFLSSRSCRLTIEDLPATLASGTAPTLQLLDGVLAHPPAEGYDTVFAWDLLDYLDGEPLAKLAERLDAVCAPGAFLFALIAYRADMPERPQRFRFIDDQTLLYQPSSERTRPAPRRNARDLARLLAGFSVEGTYLLRNGYHEYLFVKT